ncbi:MAG: UDP-N-acetylmuramoyl-L-alanyl-D-glutamate--2,6-diaminopimelate ligase [Actinomycetota bacterium]|nr:UDP-N-acetylmuramoyl-L-alanyl-D-glutamate--2,6-diaminopimelate ligase [Actinomycetota bacterium]
MTTVRELLGDGPQVEVSRLAFDNRRVQPGTLFFCVPGFTSDGHDFAADAAARGAVALVVEREVDVSLPQMLVPDARAAMAQISARFHGNPSSRLRVVGVTGTNGKTTTAFLVRSLLESAGMPCGLLGTVKSVVGDVEQPTIRTTPEAIELQEVLAAMADAGDLACAMEVSSHALQLRRVDGVCFDAAIFTNLTQDHLDFHPSMEEYFQAKRRLFAELEPEARIVNIDDPYGRRLAEEFPAAVTFGIDHPCDFRAREPELTLAGSRFELVTADGTRTVTCRLPGRFNISNVLAAVAACHALGAPLDVLVSGVAAFEAVPGRFEPVEEGQDFALLVDYAHTPDSLENVLSAARGLSRNRVVVVFGCGGDRDRGKRPQMGAIAARLADVAILTSDNPRSEDPQAIADEVLAGGSGCLRPLLDRRAAIAEAINLAQAGDVVVIAGKGHERGQEFADGRKEPFDDVQEARRALRKRVREHS